MGSVYIPVPALIAIVLVPLAYFTVRRLAGVLLGGVGKLAIAAVADHVKLLLAPATGAQDAALTGAQAQPLLAAGFTDLGSYSVDKMPGVRIRMLFHEQTHVSAHIYVHPRAGSWIEFATRYSDGSCHTLTTLPATGIEPAPWMRIVHADRSIPTDELYRQHLSQRQAFGIKPVAASDAVHEFEEGYSRGMAWKKSHGISAQEVMRVATKAKFEIKKNAAANRG